MKKLTFIILMVLTTFLLTTSVLAQTDQVDYKPMVPIPGAGEIEDFSDYVKALYLFGLAIVGVVAMLFIIIGGIRYMAAAGNEAAISDAKGQITAAVLGLVLVLTSWLILNTINPELVALKKLTIEPVNVTIEKLNGGAGDYSCFKDIGEDRRVRYYSCQNVNTCEHYCGKVDGGKCEYDKVCAQIATGDWSCYREGERSEPYCIADETYCKKRCDRGECKKEADFCEQYK